MLTWAGIRQIEMDVWADPNGTLFTTAAAEKLAGGNGTLASSEYRQPGFKVVCLCSHAPLRGVRQLCFDAHHDIALLTTRR